MIDLNIIKVAANLKNYGLTAKSTYYAITKNRLCGDLIKLQAEKKKDKIKWIKYETEACIFCQASASILSNISTRLKIKDLIVDKNKLALFFSKKNIKLPNRYKEYEILIQTKYKNRANCVMLPFNALIKALKL